MQPQRRQKKQFTCGQLAHLLFLYAVIFSLVGFGIVLALSATGKINATWTTPISATFVVLSALFGFLQWFVPRSPATSPSTPIPKSSSAPPRPHISVDPTLPKEEQVYNILLERLRIKARRYMRHYPTNGILLIRAQKTQVNTPLSISLPRQNSFWGNRYIRREKTHIRQYTIEGHPLYVAIFEETPSRVLCKDERPTNEQRDETEPTAPKDLTERRKRQRRGISHQPKRLCTSFPKDWLRSCYTGISKNITSL